ncbi:hypothetical protein EVA_15177 [gut metagenome]|uniref:Uncharacterized protein n=1 Tax=gut metagenome TaxID=749906 RepID=J9C9X8_9ZZZZ
MLWHLWALMPTLPTLRADVTAEKTVNSQDIWKKMPLLKP